MFGKYQIQRSFPELRSLWIPAESNWRSPWFGIPVPIVEVQFFDGQQGKGSFGVGKDFFETQREGGFFSKGASPSEVASFFDAVNLDEATLKEYTK